MNEIKITIEGPASSGKSTIAALIMRTLEYAGFGHIRNEITMNGPALPASILREHSFRIEHLAENLNVAELKAEEFPCSRTIVIVEDVSSQEYCTK